MTKKYEYHSIKAINKKGIWFNDGFFIEFELCNLNWAKRNEILAEETHCVAERDITARCPYFKFYSDSEVVIYFKKGLFSHWDKCFHELMFQIEEIGFTTFDLS